MAIDFSEIRALTAGEIVRALQAEGFQRRTTFVPKTLRSMIEEQAGWNEEDLRRLDLIR